MNHNLESLATAAVEQNIMLAQRFRYMAAMFREKADKLKERLTDETIIEYQGYVGACLAFEETAKLIDDQEALFLPYAKVEAL